MYISKIKSECGIAQLSLPFFAAAAYDYLVQLININPRRYNIPTFDQSELLILSTLVGNCHVWRSFTRAKKRNRRRKNQQVSNSSFLLLVAPCQLMLDRDSPRKPRQPEIVRDCLRLPQPDIEQGGTRETKIEQDRTNGCFPPSYLFFIM